MPPYNQPSFDFFYYITIENICQESNLNRENCVCVLTNKTDEDGNPIIISIKKSNEANKYYTLSLEVIKTKESNYATSMYGKDDFLVHLKNVLDKEALIYADKSSINTLIQKNSQNANSDVKLQLLERLDAIDYNKIIHQSRNLVKTYSLQNPENDEKHSRAIKSSEEIKQENRELAGQISRSRSQLKAQKQKIG